MVVIISDGGLMSVRESELKSSDVVVRRGTSGISPPRGGGGGSGVTDPSVFVKGNTITIGGKSFSVRPSEQSAFIRSRGGSVSKGIQSQIDKSIQQVKQRETQRQEQIQSQTISGQISGLPPTLSFGQAVGQSFGIGFTKFRESFITRPGPSRETRGVFEPFSLIGGRARVGGLTSRQIEILKEKDIGTPFVSRSIIREFEPGISKGELAKKVRETGVAEREEVFQRQTGSIKEGFEQELIGQRDILQGSISSGEISLAEGQKSLISKEEDIQKRFEKSIEKDLQTRTESRARQERGLSRVTDFGESLSTGLPVLLEVGAISLAPGLIAPLGVRDIVRGGESGDAVQTIGGAALVSLGAFGKLGALRRQAFIEPELQALQKQELQFLGFEVKGEKATVGTLRGQRTFQGLKEEVSLDVLVGDVGKGKFFQPLGPGTSQVRGQLEFDVLGFGKPSAIAQAESFNIQARGFSIPVSGKQSVAIGKVEKQLFGRAGALFETPRGGDFVKTTTNIEKQFELTLQSGGQSVDFVGARTTRLNERAFFTEAGPIKKLGINLEAPPPARIQGPRGPITIQEQFKGPQIILDIRQGSKGVTFQAPGETTLTSAFEFKAPRGGQDLIVGLPSSFGRGGQELTGIQKLGLASGAVKTELFKTQAPIFKGPILKGLSPTRTKTRTEVIGVQGLQQPSRLRPKQIISSASALFTPQKGRSTGAFTSASLGLTIPKRRQPQLQLQPQLQPQKLKSRQRLTQVQIQKDLTPRGFGPSGFGSGIGGFDFKGFVPILPAFVPPFGERGGRLGIKGFTIPSSRIAPSLTGIVRFDFANITGDLPKGGPLGVLPGQTRFVPKSKKKKTKQSKGRKK